MEKVTKSGEEQENDKKRREETTERGKNVKIANFSTSLLVALFLENKILCLV